MADGGKRFVNVYASKNRIFWDPEMTQPVAQMLYQREGEETLYVDAGFSTALRILEGPVCETDENSTLEEEEERQLPHNLSFNKDQTLFLIDLMRQHLTKDNSELPRNLVELNSRIRMGRGKKRLFWQEMAAKLSAQFQQIFDFEKVSRKWTTLEDAYKKAVDNNKETGKGPTKFQFFREMEELIGGHHDICFPVVGTAQSIIIQRPEIINQDSKCTTNQSACPPNEQGPSNPPVNSDVTQSSDSESSGLAVSPPAHTTGLKRKRKPKEDKAKVIDFLKECETASQKRHEEMMGQIKTANALFEKLLQSQQSD